MKNVETPRRGMTLLEVLVSLSLMLALLSALFAFFFNTIHSRNRVLEITAQHRAAASLIERLENDLIFSIAGDGRFGSGVSGDNTSIRILTRGVPIHFAERGPARQDAFRDLQLAEYRFSTRSGIRARRGNASTNGNNDTNDTNDSDNEGYESLGGSIFRVQFRYHDGVDWRDSFDAREASRLPVAVEVAVWYESWPGAPEDDEEQLDEQSRSGERERLTFEPRDTFDESAWARRADRDFLRSEPPPDRVRIIIVPDAGEDEHAIEEVGE